MQFVNQLESQAAEERVRVTSSDGIFKLIVSNCRRENGGKRTKNGGERTKNGSERTSFSAVSELQQPDLIHPAAAPSLLALPTPELAYCARLMIGFRAKTPTSPGFSGLVAKLVWGNQL
jgi:hypothetical protein